MGCYTLSHSRDHAGRATHAQPSPSKTSGHKSILLQNTNWKHLLLVGRVRVCACVFADEASTAGFPSRTSSPTSGTGTVCSATCHSHRVCVPQPSCLRDTAVEPSPLRAAAVSSACSSRRLCMQQPSPLRVTAVTSDGHEDPPRADTEARGLHQSPHGRSGQRLVDPRAARRHSDAPLHARIAGHGRALDPDRAPHADVVGAARAQGGGAG